MVSRDGQSENLDFASSFFFFGVFCADLLAVDTGNAFCLSSGGFFVGSFFAQSKSSQ